MLFHVLNISRSSKVYLAGMNERMNTYQKHLRPHRQSNIRGLVCTRYSQAVDTCLQLLYLIREQTDQRSSNVSCGEKGNL